MASRLSKEAKEVILRVLEFCKEEKFNRRPIIPLNKANLRVATATGVSIHTVSNVVKGGKIAASSGTKIGERKQRSKFDIEVIKDIIRDYHNEHNKSPSLKKLLPLVRKQIGYAISMKTFRKNLRDMGFVYERVEKNKWIIKQYSSPEIHSVELIQMDYDKQEISINHDHAYSKQTLKI